MDDTQSKPGLVTHTMWSETLLEDLYGQLRDGSSDAVIVGTLKALRARDMGTDYISRCVRSKINGHQAVRVERLLGRLAGASGWKGGSGRKIQKPRPTSSKAGLLSGLMSLLKRD